MVRVGYIHASEAMTSAMISTLNRTWIVEAMTTSTASAGMGKITSATVRMMLSTTPPK